MDFRHLVATPDALATVACDALLLVVTGDAVDTALAAPLAALLRDAVAQGDLMLKSGKALYLHRPAGVKAARVAFAVAGASTAKAFKAAVSQGLGLLKGTGAKHIAVAFAGKGEWLADHAEAVVAAAGALGLVWRYT
jgi:leucyl aminopeptidase